MKAKFVGKTSMGFISNGIYDISIKIQNVRKGKGIFCKIMEYVCVYDNNSTAWCPYSSLPTLLKNWEIYC